MISNAELPEELTSFLSAGHKLDYNESAAEPGRVELCTLDSLAVEAIHVTHADKSEDIKAVSLVSSCEGYSPEFLLAWLPEKKMFATYDVDHEVLTVFPNTSWADIVADPLPYLNAQWDGSAGEEYEPL